MQNLKAKIKYLSRYRGMRELDIMLEAFLEEIPSLSLEELETYAEFLREDEGEIWLWVQDPKSAPLKYQELTKKITCYYSQKSP